MYGQSRPVIITCIRSPQVEAGVADLQEKSEDDTPVSMRINGEEADGFVCAVISFRGTERHLAVLEMVVGQEHHHDWYIAFMEDPAGYWQPFGQAMVYSTAQ